MNAHVEITRCRAGFRVRSVDENFATFEHMDFFTLEAAERLALALLAGDPALRLVDRTIDVKRPARRGATTLERAVRLSRASRPTRVQDRAARPAKTPSREG